jgi:predicted nucleotidyltransferase
VELQPLIRDLEDVTTSVVLYSSCARGEDTSTSDIDLYIETTKKEAVREVLERHQPALSREFSPIVHTPDETYRLKAEDLPFFDSIRQGIVLSR